MAVGSGAPGGSKHPVKIFANIFISFIGAGVLGLPYAFKEAGVVEGFVIMSLVGLLSVKAMLLIIDCKYKLIQKQSPNSSPNHKNNNSKHNGTHIVKEITGTSEEKTDLLAEMEINGSIPTVKVEEPIVPQAPGLTELGYGDVGYYAVGNIGRLLVEFAIVISQIGFCCAYIIFISENLGHYIEGLTLVHWLLILLPPMAVLSLLRELSSLAISSLFAQVSNLLAFAVVFWFDFEHFHNVSIHPKNFSLRGFPFFLAIAIYCYEGAGMILSLEASLAKEVRPKFKKYFIMTLTLVTTLYISFGVCGYLSFGAETNAIITLNLPKGSSLDFAIVVKSCLCLALFFTYPVMMFPVISILEPKLIPNPGEKIWQGNVLRISMVALTGLVVMAVPNFATLMALIGATCCTLLALILPGLFHLRIFKGLLSKKEVAFDIFIIILGIIGAVIGTWDACIRLQATHRGLEHSTSQHAQVVAGNGSLYSSTSSLLDWTTTPMSSVDVIKNMFDTSNNSSGNV